MSSLASLVGLLVLSFLLVNTALFASAASPSSITWSLASTTSPSAHPISPGCISSAAATTSTTRFGLVGGLSVGFDVWSASASSASSNASFSLQWQSVASSAVMAAGPTYRAYSAATSQPNGVQAMVAGKNGTGYLDYMSEVWWSADGWQTVQSYTAPFCPRASMGYATLPNNGGLLILGGSSFEPFCTRVGQSLYSAWLAVAVEDGPSAWRQVNSSLPFRNILSAATAFASPSSSSSPSTTTVVLSGGNQGGPRNYVWLSTDTGASWQLATGEAAWAARYNHFMAADSSNWVYVLGGRDNDVEYGDVWSSSDSGFSWRSLTPTSTSAVLPAFVGLCAVAVQDQALIVYGGYSSTTGYSVNNTAWSGTYVGLLSSTSSAAATHPTALLATLLGAAVLACMHWLC